MKTLIAIPCMDTLPLGFVQSLLAMEKGGNVTVLFKPNSLVYDSRNLISLTAIEKDFDRVLWLDSDMMFDTDILTRLSAHLDSGLCEMVTGLYVRRTQPIQPVVYDILEEPVPDPQTGQLTKQIHPIEKYPKDGVFPVRGCGFGCVMTSTRLLRDVWERFGPAFSPYTWAGEDLSFCHRVNQLGYTIYCDSSVSCGHIGQWVFTDQMMNTPGRDGTDSGKDDDGAPGKNSTLRKEGG